jgi:uncharacterized protein
VIIADTSGLLAAFNTAEASHAAAQKALRPAKGIVVSPFVIAELDYLVATRIGVDAELAVLRELSGGAYELATMGAEDLASAASIVEKYQDQDIGVTDASIVVLANRYSTKRLLSLDHRHFDVVRPIGGGRFTVLP